MFSQSFFNLPGEVMSALAVILGFAMLGDMTSDEQNSLGNFLMLIAQTICTTATQRQLLEAQQGEAQMTEIQNQLKDVLNRLENLEKEIETP